LIGYGNVARSLARLLQKKRSEYPFTITGIHTLRHGSVTNPSGLPESPEFGRAPHPSEHSLTRRAPILRSS
jgi:hypothetical protein